MQRLTPLSCTTALPYCSAKLSGASACSPARARPRARRSSTASASSLSKRGASERKIELDSCIDCNALVTSSKRRRRRRRRCSAFDSSLTLAFDQARVLEPRKLTPSSENGDRQALSLPHCPALPAKVLRACTARKAQAGTNGLAPGPSNGATVKRQVLTTMKMSNNQENTSIIIDEIIAGQAESIQCQEQRFHSLRDLKFERKIL